jgi:hypothetical protein
VVNGALVVHAAGARSMCGNTNVLRGRITDADSLFVRGHVWCPDVTVTNCPKDPSTLSAALQTENLVNRPGASGVPDDTEYELAALVNAPATTADAKQFSLTTGYINRARPDQWGTGRSRLQATRRALCRQLSL